MISDKMYYQYKGPEPESPARPDAANASQERAPGPGEGDGSGGKREPGPGEGDGSEAEAGGPLPRVGSEVEAGAPPSWSSSHRLRPHGQVNESDEKGGQRVEGADLIEQGAPRRLWERP